MVRNHVKEKRGKVRMRINYEKLNDYIVFNEYYILNKIAIFNRIQGASWFTKIECKIECW